MKNRSLQVCVTLLLTLFTTNYASAEIRNGYGYQENLLSMKDSIVFYNEVLAQDKSLSSCQRKNLKSAISRLIRAVAYYEITEKLLVQFNSVSPDLYHQINTITDCRGIPVDVYIKFVPQDGTQVKSWGTTYIRQTVNDSDAASSEYGEHSVSVKIWLINGALKVLAHELGHVKYMVPNLETYMAYYRERYTEKITQFSMIGHHVTDLSGRSANEYFKLFQQDYKCFQKSNTDKIQNPIAIRKKIRKNVNSTYCKANAADMNHCNSLKNITM